MYSLPFGYLGDDGGDAAGDAELEGRLCILSRAHSNSVPTHARCEATRTVLHAGI